MVRLAVLFLASFLQLVALGASAEPAKVPKTWADVWVLEQRSNYSMPLVVRNQGTSPLRLASCGGSQAVPPGGNVTVTLAGLSDLWVVPEGLDWDCEDGPFADLFYVLANFTGPEPMVGIGLGSEADEGDDAAEDDEAEEASDEADENEDDEDEEESDEADEDEEEPDEAEGPDEDDETSKAGKAEAGGRGGDEREKAGEGLDYDVMGVQLVAEDVGGEASRTVVARCRSDICDGGQELQTLPQAWGLDIMGPKASPLSFWRHGGHHGGYHGGYHRRRYHGGYHRRRHHGGHYRRRHHGGHYRRRYHGGH
jgi:hypothetical protein